MSKLKNKVMAAYTGSRNMAKKFDELNESRYDLGWFGVLAFVYVIGEIYYVPSTLSVMVGDLEVTKGSLILFSIVFIGIGHRVGQFFEKRKEIYHG